MAQPVLTLLYDGKCPICAWEKRNLMRKDKLGRLGFIDVHAPGFDPAMYGVTHADLMGRLHAVTADGRVIKGMETLIESYRAVNWWWAYVPLGLIPRSIAERGYTWFADHRYAISKTDRLDVWAKLRHICMPEKMTEQWADVGEKTLSGRAP